MFPRLNEKGLSLLEIVLVLGAFGVVITSLAGALLLFNRRVSSSSLEMRANALMVETMEALRFVKENSWRDLGDLVPGTVYFLSVGKDPHRWEVLSADPGKIENTFSRGFKVGQVFRDAVTGQIVGAGGELDDQTLLVEASISWADRDRDRSVSLQTYLTNH